MLFDTEIYLKLPSAGYLGRGFTVYLEPMGARDRATPAITERTTTWSFRHGVGTEDGPDPATYLHYLLDRWR